MVDYDSLVGTPVAEVDPEALKAELKYNEDFLATHGTNCLDATREATPDTFPITHRAQLIWVFHMLGSQAAQVRAGLKEWQEFPELAIIERIFAAAPNEKVFKAMARVAMTYPRPNVEGENLLDFNDLERQYDAA